MNHLRMSLSGVALLACLGGFNIASATVTGSGSAAQCGLGGVTVTASTILWSPAGVDPNTGCISFGGATNIGWNGGTFTGGNADIANLPPTVGYFIHILGTTIEFQLAGLNLPSAPSDGTNCAALSTAAQLGQSCVVFVGSPFLLTLADLDPGAGVILGTSITLSAGGTVSDGVGSPGTWGGLFSTNSTKLPSLIQSTILGGDALPFTPDDGSVLEAHSETLIISSSAVPEPGTWSMLMFGAGLVGLGYRRRKA
jgi:hypothetical protein